MRQEPPQQPEPADGLVITQATFEDALVLEVVGAVDVATGARLRAALGAALADPADGPVVVDLTRVNYMSSTGIAVLADAQWEARQRDRPLRLVVGANRAVQRVLRTTGVDQLLEHHPDLEAALRESRQRG
jgi:anti-sigma B factor antagonist